MERRPFSKLHKLAIFLTILLFIPACSGPQSTLDPAGYGAQQIATLFWWMAAGAVFIWVVVIGIAIYATHVKHQPQSYRAARWLIIGGGFIFPSIVLAGLLSYGLMLLSSLKQPAEPGLRIAVSGEQWWWRVRYHPESAEPVELANEIRLPVGVRVEFTLSSPDVIHSFWIPSLGGKVDMIPGRVTTLVLEPTKTGIYRGVCAEYCGTSHALMAFQVMVMEPDAFKAWLQHQAAPAQPPTTSLAKRGQRAFLANGCGACHTIRGTPADGQVGPDLTHVGSRLSLGAGILPNKVPAFAHWVSHTSQIKPGVKMPAFGMLPEQQITALAAYLDGLK